jgi:hypothetical protein
MCLAGALLTGSVVSALASVGTVPSAPLVMVSVVSLGCVDRVLDTALLMGSVATAGSAAPIMGSVDFLFDIESRYRVVNLSNSVPMFFLNFAISLPLKSNAQLISQYLTFHNKMSNHEIDTQRGRIGKCTPQSKLFFCFGTVDVNFNCTLM